MTLHDGLFDEGGQHVGEKMKTSTKDNAGGNARFGETFVLNKPGFLAGYQPAHCGKHLTRNIQRTWMYCELSYGTLIASATT
jgi:hypothetical protein